VKGQGLGIREQGLEKAPVRGTQSFVGVMTAVWGRPSLAGLEILWRWLVGGVVLYVGAVALGSAGIGVKVGAAGLQNLSAFQPVAAVQSLHALAESILGYTMPMLRWLVPGAIVLWLVVSAVGRTIVLRRLDGAMQGRRFAMLVLGALRAGFLAVVWWIWFWGVEVAVRVSITGPASRQAEPSIVLFCAMLIVGTLALYVLWGAGSWAFYLAPLLAMQLGVGPGAALKAAFDSGAVRGKLIEINMVMNIVRIALIVLAMVFSASPLPFSSVETQTFLNCWWGGVGLVYLGMSDYFHVVRSAAYLSLWRAYNFPDSGHARGD
jgi:hypothetical protein